MLCLVSVRTRLIKVAVRVFCPLATARSSHSLTERGRGTGTALEKRRQSMRQGNPQFNASRQREESNQQGKRKPRRERHRAGKVNETPRCHHGDRDLSDETALHS